ncbi:MAG: 2-dehydropantoate 2-reductase [Hyphomicrobiales bacterium]|nr:MAG: 2-dehydropantoate 2-reductase [Hyphomicrobiales bacterium]
MKIGIVGAGALGGMFGARLAQQGHTVSVLARGKTLDALRRNGIRLHSGGQWITEPVKASDTADDLGVQDVVLIAVKSPALASASEQISGLLDSGTVVVPALNGIPWWFSHGGAGDFPTPPQRTNDPDDQIAARIDTAAVVGCVVFPSCSSPEPGVSVHVSGSRVILGEAAGADTTRAARLAQFFTEAGFDATATTDIRAEVWRKLLGNICFNPVSLLVGTTTDKLIDDPRTGNLFVAMMNEMLSLGENLGISIETTPESRLAMTRTLGAVKTSMLQDAEASRPVEIHTIIGSVVRIADTVGAEIPHIRTVHALAHQRADVLGILPPPLTHAP